VTIGESRTGPWVEPDAEVRAERCGDGDERVEAWIRDTCFDSPDEASIETGDLRKVRDGRGRVSPNSRDVDPDRAMDGAEPTLRFALGRSIPQLHGPSEARTAHLPVTCLADCTRAPSRRCATPLWRYVNRLLSAKPGGTI